MDYKNTLFINFGGIGDEILFLPTIFSVKEKFPDSKITLCLEPRSKGIKSLCPLIDETFSRPLRRENQNYFRFYFPLSLTFPQYVQSETADRLSGAWQWTSA